MKRHLNEMDPFLLILIGMITCTVAFAAFGLMASRVLSVEAQTHDDVAGWEYMTVVINDRNGGKLFGGATIDVGFAGGYAQQATGRDLSSVRYLDTLGADGWEAVTFISEDGLGFLLMKRPLQ